HVLRNLYYTGHSTKKLSHKRHKKHIREPALMCFLCFLCLLWLISSYQMLGINIEFIANVLMDFPVRQQGIRAIEGMRFGEGLGILQSDFHLKVPEIGSAVALDDMQFLGMRDALAVQPGFVVESDGIDDKRVTIPLGDGIAHP